MVFKLMTAVLMGWLLLPQLQKDSPSIQWTAARRLAWDDFRSDPDDNSTNAALTASTIGFKYKYDTDNGFTYNITCLFEKNISWGRIKTDYILAHEQGHFDIAEIFARKLHKAIRAYNFNPATAQKDVPAIYQKIMKDLAAAQDQYDSETDFSRDKEAQAEWLEKIDAQLAGLKTFANYH